jgi:hypothetical protein
MNFFGLAAAWAASVFFLGFIVKASIILFTLGFNLL